MRRLPYTGIWIGNERLEYLTCVVRNENLTRKRGKVILTLRMRYVIIFPCSRGASGALYPQSALVGVMLCRGLAFWKLPVVSGDDVWVLRNGNPRIVSGRERSSTKRNLSCDARVPEPSKLRR